MAEPQLDLRVRNPAALGEAVAIFRTHHGLTQQQVADEVGTNRSVVAHLEQGLRIPDGELLERICKRLKMPEHFWIGFRAERCAPGATLVRSRFITYFTRWDDAVGTDVRRDKLVFAIKNDERWRFQGKSLCPYAHCAKLLKRRFGELLRNRVLVPVPRSRASRDVPDREWPALRLAQEIAATGTGLSVQRLFARTKKIRQSSIKGSKRPSVREHMQTLAFAEENLPPAIVLIDDVVTRGTTMAACAKLLREAGWPGAVEALAVAYTKAPEEDNPAEWREFAFGWDGSADYPVRSNGI
jgi:transcriptional regulator with XRE-family HTH domain